MINHMKLLSAPLGDQLAKIDINNSRGFQLVSGCHVYQFMSLAVYNCNWEKSRHSDCYNHLVMNTYVIRNTNTNIKWYKKQIQIQIQIQISLQIKNSNWEKGRHGDRHKHLVQCICNTKKYKYKYKRIQNLQIQIVIHIQKKLGEEAIQWLP